MLNLPASAAFERRIPKQKFYTNLTVTPELRRFTPRAVRAASSAAAPCTWMYAS